MPVTKPSLYPDFCLTGTRDIPPNGVINSGYLPDQIPPCEEHNFLFGTTGDWIRWLDQITANPGLFPVSNAGHHVATATNLQGQLDQLDAVLSTLGLIHEVPTGAVDGSNAQFQLSQAPINADSVVAFLDGLEDSAPEYTVQHISGQWYVVFDPSFIPAAGQTVNVMYMTGSSGVGVGGGVGAIANDSGGVGLFDHMDINVAKFKALKAGTNVTVTDNLDGTVSISSTGGGGGAAEIHGSASAPVAIDPAVGIPATSADEQIWWVRPNAGSGGVPITALLAIAAGVSVGQRMIVKSVASANYLIIPNLAGTDQNGNCNMGTFGQSIQYTWDGLNWSEDSRRV